MAVERKVTRVVIAKDLVRYKVRLTHEDCIPDTQEALIRQHQFLHWLADNYDLLNCGPSRCKTIRIFHNGKCWQADAEAEVQEPTTPDEVP